MASFKKHGPGTETNTECDITTWLGYVRKIGSNPFQAIDGIEMRVRLAYFDIVVRKYVDEAKVQLALHVDRMNVVDHKDWKEVVNQYKFDAKQHAFGMVDPRWFP